MIDRFSDMKHIEIKELYFLVKIGNFVKSFGWNNYETIDKALDAAREWRDEIVRKVEEHPSFQFFMDDVLITETGSETDEKEIKKNFKAWLLQNSEMKTASPLTITKMLTVKYGPSLCRKGKMMYQGVRIRQPDE